MPYQCYSQSPPATRSPHSVATAPGCSQHPDTPQPAALNLHVAGCSSPIIAPHYSPRTADRGGFPRWQAMLLLRLDPPGSYHRCTRCLIQLPCRLRKYEIFAVFRGGSLHRKGFRVQMEGPAHHLNALLLFGNEVFRLRGVHAPASE
jgi:hypothetical protein